MNTTYNSNSEEMNNLNAVETIDWGMATRNKPVLSLIKHLMEAQGQEDYVIRVSIMQAKTIVHLMSYEGVAIKTLSLRHWHNSYAGVQIVGSGAFALVSGEWINL